jgi:hypothetical protein
VTKSVVMPRSVWMSDLTAANPHLAPRAERAVHRGAAPAAASPGLNEAIYKLLATGRAGVRSARRGGCDHADRGPAARVRRSAVGILRIRSPEPTFSIAVR